MDILHPSTLPQTHDPVLQAAPEPQADRDAAAALHQGTLALETAPGHLSLPALPGQCVCGGRYQGHDPRQKALGSVLFPARSGQGLVLWGTQYTDSCADQTGLPDEGTPLEVGTRE